ncbi:rRNA (adenine-N6,N6-)-dimethyltransferase [Aureococcus anophagefferens]|nr:rRNA (adenine-N6,N6-)-dimethyltransferase [Aureococcus anophagefferens]
MVREVAKRVENDPRKHRLEMVHGDVLKVALPYFDVCEEFAQRLSAKPGDALYCRLSVNTQLLAKVTQLIKVGRNNFRRRPRSTRRQDREDAADLETPWKTFRALSMTDADEAADAPDVKALVEAIMEDPRFKDKRAAKMDLDDFLALLVAFNEKGLHFSS